MKHQKLYLVIIGILCLQLTIKAQNIEHNNLDEFEYVRDYIERNHSGFTDNVNESNRTQYEHFVEELRQNISNDPSKDHILVYLKRYLAYFKDNHLSISQNSISFDDQDEAMVKEFMESSIYRNREEVKIDQDTIKSYLEKSTDPIEGFYSTSNNDYEVAVIRNQNVFRDYYAVILESNTPIWPAGKVKFELKQIAENEFEGYFYYKYYSLQIKKVSFDGNKLGSWVKKGTNSSNNSAISNQQNKYYRDQQGNHIPFRALSDSTYYLQIGSFGGQYYQLFDSLLSAHYDSIISRPNLIFDVRGNGGGSDALVQLTLPFIYDKPVRYELSKVYVTKDNLNAYRSLLEQVENNVEQYGEETLIQFRRLVEKMENQPLNTYMNEYDRIEELGREGSIKIGDQQFEYVNKLTDHNNYKETKINKTLEKPRKVIVLMDKGCASSCETFILFAKQSDKTITMGNNSGGFNAYGNVFPIQTPAGYNLHMPTTRYANGLQFEFVGIPPDVKLDPNSDWIEQALNQLENKN